MTDNNNNNIPDEIENFARESRKNKLEHFEYLERHLQEIGTHTSVILEFIVALLVFVACVIGIVTLFPAMGELVASGGDGDSLIHFLEQIFTVVIGIEFLKMLCKPSSANVLETIVFLVARHMILGEMTPLEDLFCVIAIVILIVTKRFIIMSHKKKK